MAIYRQIHIDFWQDKFVLDLTPEEKYFYLYLMSNSKTTQCGIYELPTKIIEFETGYNRETVEKLLQRFMEYNKILYDDETKEIMMLNWIKYNGSSSPKVKARIEKELLDVKNKQFINIYYRLSIQYGYPIDTQSQQEEEQEQEKEQEENQEQEKAKEEVIASKDKIPPVPYKEIKDLYNTICKSLSSVRSLSSTRKDHIKARWKQFSYNLEEFETAFTKAEQSEFCTGNNKKGWKVDFDWIIKNDSNMLKVLEGKYDGGGNNGKSSSSDEEHDEYAGIGISV